MTQSDRSRRNNINTEGVKENENKTWDDTAKKVEDIIKNKLGITKHVIIERGGNKQNKTFNKSRTIFAKLTRLSRKETNHEKRK